MGYCHEINEFSIHHYRPALPTTNYLFKPPLPFSFLLSSFLFTPSPISHDLPGTAFKNITLHTPMMRKLYPYRGGGGGGGGGRGRYDDDGFGSDDREASVSIHSPDFYGEDRISSYICLHNNNDDDNNNIYDMIVDAWCWHGNDQLPADVKY